jgi:hypothetical protein
VSRVNRQVIQAVSTAATAPYKPTGTLSVLFPLQQYDQTIWRMTVAGPGGSIARVCVGPDASSPYRRAISYFGQDDDADFSNGLFVPTGQQLLVAWFDIQSPNTILAPGLIVSPTATALATIDVEINYDQYR